MISYLKSFLLITIIIFIVFLIASKFMDINLALTSQHGKKFNAIGLNLIVSIILSILILTLLYKGKISIYFHIFWLIPILLVSNHYLLRPYTFEKIDYLFGYKNNSFIVNQKVDENGWIINEIIVNKQDTIYYSENPSWTEFTTNFEQIKRSTISKSLFKRYYHLKINND